MLRLKVLFAFGVRLTIWLSPLKKSVTSNTVLVLSLPKAAIGKATAIAFRLELVTAL